MKKLIYLFALSIGAVGCSVDSLDSEQLTVADAKFISLENSGSFNFPEVLCPGVEAEYCLEFPQATTGNGASKETNVQVQLYDVISGEYIQIFQGNFHTEACFPYTFESSGTYQVRYKIGNDWTDDSVTIGGSLCGTVCTYGKGYWTNHSSDNPGEQENVWPVSELMLGNHEYSQDELNTILDVPNNEGNNLVIFSQHLIAAKLNVANGAGNSEIEATIVQADELIGNLVVLVDSFSEAEKREANILKGVLEEYNEGGCE